MSSIRKYYNMKKFKGTEKYFIVKGFFNLSQRK